MRQWLFEKKDIRNSPSFKDDIDSETEDRYRREGVRFLMDIGSELKLSPHPTLATAAVYFHRFYMYHSFKEFSRHEEVMSVERVLLQTIKFDLQVEHPYTFLLKYVKIIKVDKEKARNMVQMAWTFVNDSLCTTLCLQWEPEIIGIALMYLASRLSKVDITDWHGKKGERGERWWDQLVENMSMNLLEDICHQVLDLYSSSTAKSSSSSSAPAPQATSSPAAPTSTPSSSSTSSRVSPYPPNHPTPSPGARMPAPPPGTPVHLGGPPILGSLNPLPQASGSSGALPPLRAPLQGQPPPMPTPSPQHQYPLPPPGGGYTPRSGPPHPQGVGFPYLPPPGHGHQVGYPPPGHNHGGPPPPIRGGGFQQNYHSQNSYSRGY